MSSRSDESNHEPPAGAFRFTHPVDVRFRDLDLGGHVHHTQAFVYFEEARGAYWRDVTGRSDPGEIDFILAEASVRYHRRILYPQCLQVGVRIAVLAKKYFVMEYAVRSEEGERLVTGSTTLFMYDYSEGRTVAVPEEVRSRIEAREGGPLPSRRDGGVR